MNCAVYTPCDVGLSMAPTQGHLLKETIFRQLSVPSISLTSSAILCLPSSFKLGFSVVWVCTDMVYAVTTVVSSHVHISCCVWKAVLTCIHSLVLSFTIFFSLLCKQWYQIFVRIGYDIDVPFVAECSAISYTLLIDQSWAFAKNQHLLQK